MVRKMDLGNVDVIGDIPPPVKVPNKKTITSKKVMAPVNKQTMTPPRESGFGLPELKGFSDILGQVTDSIGASQQYKAKAKQYESLASVDRINALNYFEQADFAIEESRREGEVKEVEGKFSYGEQVGTARSTGLASGDESFGAGTGLGSVIEGTRNTFLQEAQEIRTRGQRRSRGLRLQGKAAEESARAQEEAARAAAEAADDNFLTGILTVAGTVGGFMIGGPAGAMAGSQIGSTVGKTIAVL